MARFQTQENVNHELSINGVVPRVKLAHALLYQSFSGWRLLNSKVILGKQLNEALEEEFFEKHVLHRHWQLFQLSLLIIGGYSLVLVILPNVVEMIVYKVLEMLGKRSFVVELC